MKPKFTTDVNANKTNTFNTKKSMNESDKQIILSYLIFILKCIPIIVLIISNANSSPLNKSYKYQQPFFTFDLFPTSLSIYSLFQQCKFSTSSNWVRSMSFLKRRKCIWSKLWKEISYLNKSDICEVISILYPTIVKGRFGGYRNYFYSTDKIKNFDQNFFEKEKTMKWPDDSYQQWVPKNLTFNKRSILMGQKYIQNELWRRQHPPSCNNVTFCLIQTRQSGLGCDIHSYAISMGYCMSQPNTVFDFVPEERDVWAHGPFCKKNKNFRCFVEPLTNCSVPKDHIEREKRSYKRRKYQGFIMPDFVKNILSKSLISEEYYEWYWTVAASTYLMRLNKNTIEWLDSFESKNVVNPKPFYDLAVHVRHGDKYKEMKLINAKNYFPAIQIYSKIFGKKLDEINVFVSTEDPDVINWFINQSGCSVSYVKYARNNPNLRSMVKMGDNLALISLANLRLSLRTNVRVDTMASNWNRLIFELMQTTTENAEAMVFEMGIMSSLTAEHYTLLKNWKLAQKWSYLPDKKILYEPDDL